MEEPDIQLIQKVVDLMNDALYSDQAAISDLVAARVPCNEYLAVHKTIQCGSHEGQTTVGLLGILNGLCGIKSDGYGYVVAVSDDDNTDLIIRFEGKL